jgi:flavin-binding protein dodecin
MSLRDDAWHGVAGCAHGLQPGRSIRAIPRLRYTPDHRIRSNAKASPDDAAKDAINARTVETDHAKVRDLIVAYVRATGNQVVACAEMTYQVALARDGTG